MTRKDEILSGIKETGVVAVIRADTPSNLVKVAEALREGGVRFIEFAMTVPGAIDVIREAVAQMKGNTVIGAGTVLDAETAREVILAGAEFIVSPVFNPSMVEVCRRYSITVVPGAFTPTEILTAWREGADIVKVFPAGLGGPKYFKDLKDPLPQIDIMPTGGVNLETAPEFIKAGACAIAVGKALAGKELIAAGDYNAIMENARKFIEVVRKAREAL